MTASVATAPTSDVTVEVSAAPVSPAVAGDYTLSGTTTLTIAANTTSSTGTVTITAAGNDVASADKRVTVTGAVTGGGYSRSVSETLTIRNDDPTELTADEGGDGTMVTEGRCNRANVRCGAGVRALGIFGVGGGVERRRRRVRRWRWTAARTTTAGR